MIRRLLPLLDDSESIYMSSLSSSTLNTNGGRTKSNLCPTSAGYAYHRQETSQFQKHTFPKPDLRYPRQRVGLTPVEKVPIHPLQLIGRHTPLADMQAQPREPGIHVSSQAELEHTDSPGISLIVSQNGGEIFRN